MLDYTKDGRVAVIDLDDGKANAISHAFCKALTEALDRAQQEADAVALVGRPGRFCAGFDLNEFKKGPEATASLLAAGARVLLRLFSHPQPLVIGCTGHALAGGALILLTGDTRIGAAGDFKIGLNETALGMTLPPFGLRLSQFRLARRYLQAAYIQAHIFDPPGACDAGFLDSVSSAEEVRENAIETATALSQLPADAYRGNKLAIRGDTIGLMQAELLPEVNPLDLD